MPASPARLARRPLLGIASEAVAAFWLQSHGCRVLSRRRRIAGVEIDLLARHGDLLLIVEVKGRGPRSGLLHPDDLVTPRQRRRLHRSAEALGLRERLACRVDVILVRWGLPFVIRWHRGPWSP